MALEDRTKEALDAFNNAKGYGNYDKLTQYLSPHHVIIHRVDDITPIQGTAAEVVNIFNHYQTKIWPRFEYDKSSYKQVGRIVWVKGTYYDTDASGQPSVSVTCGYHFDLDENIDVAFAYPS
jgi:hypothetical protein